MQRWEMKEFLNIATIRSLADGDLLFSAGEVNQRLYFLHHGTVHTYTMSNDMQKRFERVYCAGDAFGSLMESAQRPATLGYAVGDVIVAEVSLTGFKRLMQNCPSTCYGLFRYMAEQKEQRLRHHAQVLQSKSKQRVIHVLFDMARRLGKGQQSQFDVAPFTHQDIADTAGLRRTTVSEVISELRSDGVIVGKGRRFEVIRPQAESLLSLSA